MHLFDPNETPLARYWGLPNVKDAKADPCTYMQRVQNSGVLIKKCRRVITREEFLNEVWGYECYPCTRTVDTHMQRLRQKLESEPGRPKHLLTVHGTGYRFLP